MRLSRLRPYAVHLALAIYTPVLLFVDSRTASIYEQYLLGALTFFVLFLVTRLSSPQERRQVWLCVGVATGFEVLGSLILGLYTYRFHNVPLFVPPGHGLVYYFGLSAARTPLMLKHGRKVALLVLGLAGGWATAGLTLLPVVTGRVDVLGASCIPILAWFLLRHQRSTVFAAIFFATTGLELFGTNFGNWMWQPAGPHFPYFPSGNPPSAIAGGYCVIDGSVAIVSAAIVQALSRARGVLRLPARVPDLVPDFTADLVPEPEQA
jgi:hypothetical protein